LRLFIISIDASAELDILVVGHTGSFSTHIHGEACGHVDFFFFSIEGCVSITIGPDNAKPDLFNLVQKLSIKSRSPALLVGTGVDKPIDTSLGEGLQQDGQPGGDAFNHLPIVPIDSILVLGVALPPIADGLKFAGADVTGTTGQAPGTFVQRGSENYSYTLTSVTLERSDGGVALLGSNAPATWWTPGNSSDANVNAQLALLTWEPDPATKAIEKTSSARSRSARNGAPSARTRRRRRGYYGHFQTSGSARRRPAGTSRASPGRIRPTRGARHRRRPACWLPRRGAAATFRSTRCAASSRRRWSVRASDASNRGGPRSTASTLRGRWLGSRSTRRQRGASMP